MSRRAPSQSLWNTNVVLRRAPSATSVSATSMGRPAGQQVPDPSPGPPPVARAPSAVPVATTVNSSGPPVRR